MHFENVARPKKLSHHSNIVINIIAMDTEDASKTSTSSSWIPLLTVFLLVVLIVMLLVIGYWSYYVYHRTPETAPATAALGVSMPGAASSKRCMM